MSVWNEETLRKAAAWKAFKEGEVLLRDGCVADAARTDQGWRGTVHSGKRPLRVSVAARSATDLETRCSCPENQSSGALCCHAVAAGLAVLRGYPEKSTAKAAAPVAAPKDIILGPNWREALVRGKLAVSIVPSQRGDLHVADHRLLAELAAARVSAEKETLLHLGGTQLATFLKSIS